MIHIASCQPDSAERPLWNTLPTLDNVAWADLPGELRKVSIPVFNVDQVLLTGPW